MASRDESRELNPQVIEFQIGLRDLRSIKVYPLSVGDQLKLTKIVTEAIALWVESNPNEELTAESVSAIIALAQDRIHDILKIVFNMTKKRDIDAILEVMSNAQFSELIKIVYETNYQGPIKNVASLFNAPKEPEIEIPKS
jgi:ABC-type transport system involved in cytochrome c biogenesis ATPase subunit